MFGTCITWPVLIPLATYGGIGSKQLDQLTFGNIKESSWLIAHALIAWVFYGKKASIFADSANILGFILYMISRECVYFVNLRQAYLLSPYYAKRLSSRTVLFTCVPLQVLSEKKLRRIFGDTVKSVWIPRETDDLEELVNEREQTAYRLEKAEIELIKKANAAYRKALKNGHPDIEATLVSSSPRESEEKDEELEEKSNGAKEVNVTIAPTSLSASSSSQDDNIRPGSPREFTRTDGTPIMSTNYGMNGPPDVNGSVAAQWIPASQRPIHRPIANYGRRVDTIKWTRNRLKALAPQIGKLRRDYRKGNGKAIPSAFIEFHTQVDAQAAYQTLAHHRANHMRSEIVGVRPEEIVWNSLRYTWWERIMRRFAVQAFVAVMVIFFAIPAALVGMVSNISLLTQKIKFLSFIDKLPTVLLGLIQGLLPAIALSMLMAAVPKVMRACARQSGIPTESRIELFVQNTYFVFQVIQVFLITTLTSAASAVLQTLLKNPMEARTLIATNLPKASNFYISYFILQGLAMSATRLVHLGSVFRHRLMANSGDTPRFITTKYHRLRKIHWGSVFPVFTNMGVIAISYSLIAPIVLGVAVIGFFLIYVSYRYNLLYVYSSERDTRGLCYPRALKQLLTGVYLAEICLIGLFSIKLAFIPLVMMFGLAIFTFLIHFSLSDALSPLLYNLPRTLAAEEELREAGNSLWDAENLQDKDEVEESEEQPNGYDSDFDPSDPTDITVSHGEQNSRGIRGPEGTEKAFNLTTGVVRNMVRKKMAASPIPGFIELLNFWSYWITPPAITKPNFLIKFLHPEVFEDYQHLRTLQPDEIRQIEVQYEEGVLKDAYSPPAMKNKSPRLWIPRDTAGVSVQEVRHSGKAVEIRDDGAWLNAKGQFEVELEGESERWILREWERVKF